MMAISAAPVGPELDADVLRCAFAGGCHESWRRMAFSTDPAATLKLLEHLTITAIVTIRWIYDEQDDLTGGEGVRWHVDLEGDNVQDDGEWEAEGEGTTLPEAICRAATHVVDQEPPAKAGGL